MLIFAHRVHEHDLSAHLLQNKKWRHAAPLLIATRDQIYATAASAWQRRAGDTLSGQMPRSYFLHGPGFGHGFIDLRNIYRFDVHGG